MGSSILNSWPVRRFAASMCLVCLMLVLAGWPPLFSLPPAEASSSTYGPNELNCELYWFEPAGANQEFVSGEATPCFAPPGGVDVALRARMAAPALQCHP